MIPEQVKQINNQKIHCNAARQDYTVCDTEQWRLHASIMYLYTECDPTFQTFPHLMTETLSRQCLL